MERRNHYCEKYPPKHLYKDPALKELLRVSKHVSNCWMQFAVELGLKPEKVDAIDAENGSISNKCYSVLNTWLKSLQHPCWCEVAKALEMVDLVQMSKNVSDTYLSYALEQTSRSPSTVDDAPTATKSNSDMIGTTLSDTGLNVSKEIVVLGETTALKPKQEAFQVKSQPCSSESAKYELPQIILPTRSSASNIIAVDEIHHVNFSEVNVHDAFIHLENVFMRKVQENPTCFSRVKHSCAYKVRDSTIRLNPSENFKLYNQIQRTRNADALFRLLQANPNYHNWMTIGFLDAITAEFSKLKVVLEKYKTDVFRRTLDDVWLDLPRYESRKQKFFSRTDVVIKLGNRDPKEVTVQDLLKDQLNLAEMMAQAMALRNIEEGCIRIFGHIATNNVYQSYLSSLIMIHKSKLVEYMQIGPWIVHSPQCVLQELIKCYAATPTSTLLVGYYYDVLLKYVNADQIVGEMISAELLSIQYQDIIFTVHSAYQRSRLLLLYTSYMNTQAFFVFSAVVRNHCPKIGSLLNVALQSDHKSLSGVHIAKEDFLKPALLEQHSYFMFEPTQIHIAFLHLMCMIGGILLTFDARNIFEKCLNMMASDTNKLRLLSDIHISKLKEYQDTIPLLLWSLSPLITWNDHSILKIFVSGCSEAVNLLDKFDSRLTYLMNQSISIASYPIPHFSSDMIPTDYDSSTHTILAIRCEKKLHKCSLQYVCIVKSMMMNKYDVTEHCLQLLAVRSNPFILYWTIPNHIVSHVSDNIPHYDDSLYSQGILEIIVYPKLLLISNDDISLRELVFSSEFKWSNEEVFEVKEELDLQIKQMGDEIASLQSLSELQNKELQNVKNDMKLLTVQYQKLKRDKEDDLGNVYEEDHADEDYQDVLELHDQSNNRQLINLSSRMESLIPSIKKSAKEFLPDYEEDDVGDIYKEDYTHEDYQDVLELHDQSGSEQLLNLSSKIESLIASIKKSVKEFLPEFELPDDNKEKGNVLDQLNSDVDYLEMLTKQTLENASTVIQKKHNYQKIMVENVGLTVAKNRLMDLNSELESQISVQKEVSNQRIEELESKLKDFQEGKNVPSILEGKEEMIGVHLIFSSSSIRQYFVNLFDKSVLQITSVEEDGSIKGKIWKTISTDAAESSDHQDPPSDEQTQKNQDTGMAIQAITGSNDNTENQEVSLAVDICAQPSDHHPESSVDVPSCIPISQSDHSDSQSDHSDSQKEQPRSSTNEQQHSDPSSSFTHAQDTSNTNPSSLSLQSSGVQSDTSQNSPVPLPTSHQNSAGGDTMEEASTTDVAVMGESISEANTGRKQDTEQMDLDDIVEEQEPVSETAFQESDTGASNPTKLLLASTEQINLPLEAKSSIVSGISDSGATFLSTKKSEKICNAVSEYYKAQFIDKWKKSTKHDRQSNIITCIAALLVERKGKFKVVLLTAGTRLKQECSYFTRIDDANEPQWGLCDGHAVAVCYRLASFYLLTEIYKLHNGQESILNKTNEGYMLKDDIKLHLFSSHPPCGFFSKKERHFLSWKRPFIGKPHSLQCSSIILINAFLGIQGPLSHLFVKPVYISSITIPRYESISIFHVKEHLDKFHQNISDLPPPSTPGNHHQFYRPHVQTIDIDIEMLFSKHFILFVEKDTCKQYRGQVKHPKKGALKTAGTIPDTIGNSIICALVFTLEDGIGSTNFRDSVIKHTSEALHLSPELKQQRMESLQESRVRLSRALNVSEALQVQKQLIAKHLKEQVTVRCQKVDDVILQVEKCRAKCEELEAKFAELDTSLEKIENHEIAALRDAVFLNKEFHRMHNELERLQEMEKLYSSDPEFYLELMGCDWARYMEIIHNDINSVID